jgi:hypothetical protein
VASRLDVPAAATGPPLDIRVEPLDGHFELLLDVGNVHGDFVKAGIASVAEPEERLRLVRGPLDLHDEPPRVSGPVGRVRHEGGHQEELALGPRMIMAVNCESSQITLLPTGGSKS